MANLFSIAPVHPFNHTLAEFILGQGFSEQEIANSIVLLPTRRACRDFLKAFAQTNTKQAFFCPQVLSLGDSNEDEIYFATSDIVKQDIVSNLQLQFILTRLVQQKNNSNLSEAFYLAQDLAHLISQTETALLSFDDLKNIKAANYAEHWGQILDFLKIVTHFLPEILKETGKITPALARAENILNATKFYSHKAQLGTKIIIAGSTGSLPPTRKLIKTLAEFENTYIILPGLDFNLSEADFNDVTPTHPQFGMKDLLDDLKAKPWQVKEITPSKNSLTPNSRLDLISKTMLPSSSIKTWEGVKLPTDCTAGITSLTLNNVEEEALAISLIIKKSCFEKKTVALVTPDRNLAKRVSVKLKKFGILADDSSGTPFDKTPLGRLICAVADCVTKNFSALSLVTLLNSAYITFGLERKQYLETLTKFEKFVLRKIHLYNGLDDLKNKLVQLNLDATLQSELVSFIDKLLKALEPLKYSSQTLKAKQWWQNLLTSLHNLGADAHLTTDNSLAELNQEINEHADLLPDLTISDFSKILPLIMNFFSVRPPMHENASVIILGQIEARLLDVDTVILGSLNDGTFPKNTVISPWMSETMRVEFGLPPSTRKIGLAAHDFTQALGKCEVFLTRALKDGGTPTNASRFILRLEALLSSASLKLEDSQTWYNLVKHYTSVKELTPPKRAEANPPLDARQFKNFYVTKIERLLHSPYDFYAENILKLRPLDELEKLPELSDFGNFVHEGIAKYINKGGGSSEQLLQMIESEFTKSQIPLDIQHFWITSLKRIAQFVADDYNSKKHLYTQHLLEQVGEAKLDGFNIAAKADRIDKLQDGSVTIIDYKTGAVPKNSDVSSGWNPQLTLEAIICEAGGFVGINHSKVSEIAYYKLGGQSGGKITRIDLTKGDILENTRHRIAQLLHEFCDKPTPFIARHLSEYSLKYSNYEHLARII